MTTRISTSSLHQASLKDINALQSSLANVQRQISSGQSVNSFSDLNKNGKVERVLGSQGRLQKVDDYISNNIIIIGRVNATNTALSKIVDIASSFRDLMTLRRSPAGSETPVKLQAESYLATVADNLNLKFEGRYLFAGSQTTTIPVGDIINNSNMVNGEPTTNYYAGDDETLAVKNSDNLALNYNVKANETAFKNLIGALHVAIAGAETDDDSKFAQAVDMINVTISELVQTTAQLSNHVAVLQQTNTSHSDVKIYLNELIAEATETDIPQATIQASLDQTTLQATFQTFARISQLTLTKYL